MNSRLAFFVRTTFVFLDLFILNIIFFVVKWYELYSDILNDQTKYFQLWFISNLVWVTCSWFAGVYTDKTISKFERFLTQTAKSYCFFLVLTLVYIFFYSYQQIARTFGSIFLSSFFAGLVVNRLAYLLTWLQFRNREHLIKRVLIIGYNEMGKKLATYFERTNTHVRVVGFCDENHNVTELSNYPILNTPGNAVKASKEFQINEIYSTILPEQDNRIYELMHHADRECIRFKLVPDFTLFVNRPMHLSYLSGMPVLTTRTEPLEDLVNRVNKRLFDIIFSVFAIIFILSWLTPLIALAIWLDSKGPLFFVQKRSGLNNKPFDCYKFRSMKVNADANFKQARRDDKRFTRIGRFLRKTNLDEFPQFFNVLKGEMSIVGPRPHMVKHTEDYSAVINKYMVRQFLKPGITGWAQVNGYRGETRRLEDMKARVDHDLWYLENWTIMLDIKIIFLTARNLITGEKNAF